MRSRTRSMPPALMDRFPHPDKDPLELVIAEEDTPENREKLLLEERKAAIREKARLRLITTYRKLSYEDRGSLAALWTDVCGWSRQEVAVRFQCTLGSVGVAKWKALAHRPCGETGGRCERIPGCAHQYGAELEKDLLNRVASELKDEVAND
jgi:hypothetical protein